MKKFLFLIAMMLTASIGMFAQSSLIATLSHEGQIRAFYGGNALYQAHQAAVTGDVITLSGGSFSAITVTKAITIRGAGMVANQEAQTYPTNISGSFYINVADTTNRLIMEGLNFLDYVYLNQSLYRPYFQKCKFFCFNCNSSSNKLRFATFINCHVEGHLSFCNSTMTCINSYINCPNAHSSSSTNVYEFQNCVIRIGNYGNTNPYYGFNNIQNSTASNSIFVQNMAASSSLPSSNTIYSCVATGNGNAATIFKNLVVGNNKVVADITKLFKVFTGTNYSVDISFELTEEAATTYLGTDGTQVGMYGGPLPFDPTISSLKITKCNVASKSTADGKLSVDIEVSGME